MPRKPKKTLEEKATERFEPLYKKEELKRTTEVEEREKVPERERYKIATQKRAQEENYEVPKGTITKRATPRPSQKELIKIEKKGTRGKKTKAVKTFSAPKVTLKKGGYELIITEKPQAAKKIAEALGRTSKKMVNKVPYYEVIRNKRKIVVACAVGHLFTLSQEKKGNALPEFDIQWVPNFTVRKRDFTKRYHDLIKSLVKGAGEITIATDFDVEGEVIGMNVVRYICGQKDASRMKFSTLTKKEIEDAYEKKGNSLIWGQGIAGETRHYLDWWYGINLSRALMHAVKTTGKFKIMSIGRVQGPTLKLIVDKEREIQKFTPQTYWEVTIDVEHEKKKIVLKHPKNIFDPKELKDFEGLTGEKIALETKKTKKKIPPGEPFNLTTLQTEAYKHHGITPANTLKTAQSLYLRGLISYPRTSSQKLPESIGYQSILKKVAKAFHAENLITRKKPVEGKKTDPAHPSIYPTGESEILAGYDEKVYNLVAKRFIALFCDDAILEQKRISGDVRKKTFAANGVNYEKKGWMEIYPTKQKETLLPDIHEEKIIKNQHQEEKETKPPKRYSPASIVSELEKRNLGTKATRATIIETLFDRGYVRDTSIQATPLGLSLVETLEKYSPIIIDEGLTRNFEEEMEQIEQSTKDYETKEQIVLGKAKEKITEITRSFVEKEKEIGKELIDGRDEMHKQEREENQIMPCPECKKGTLQIRYSKKVGRYFVGCDNYPKCKATYSLPPNAIIKTTKKTAENGLPILVALRKGKRPWEFEFNPNWKAENSKE